MSARGLMVGSVVLASVLGLSACGEKPQTATQRKVDATAYSGSTVNGYTAPGWKAGDKVSWDGQMRERNKGQDEYGR
jgi:hypothetical protein